jgi:uncharacterized protein involved in outer membrane biogenesis
MFKKILIVLGALVVVSVLLLSRDWDSPELGRKILGGVSAATGVQIQAEGFRLNLLKGVTLDKVEANYSGQGRQVAFKLNQMVFEHRLLPLLSGTVAVERILLARPSFELAETKGKGAGSGKAAPSQGAPADATGGAEGGSGGGFALEVEEIRIEDGSLSVKNVKGEEKTRAEGLDFEMRNVAFDPSQPSLAAISAEGSLGIEKMTFDTLSLTEVEGDFRLEEAVFVIPDLSFAMPNARFTSGAKLDMHRSPFTYALTAKGEPLDLNGMVGAKEGFSPATIHLEAQGAGPETKDLKADGRLVLPEGRFPDAPMFQGIDAALGKKAIVGSPYKATEATFRMENDRVTLDPFRFESGDARIDARGTIALAGTIDFDLSVATPREGLRVEGVGSNALDILADDQGWVPIPIDITGTMDNPKVRPDVKALGSQTAKGAKREAAEKATDALRGLIKKKND